jgi:hypothetical protein
MGHGAVPSKHSRCDRAELGAVGVTDEDLKPVSVIVLRRASRSTGSRETCREPATKAVGMGTVRKAYRWRSDVRLCGPSGPVVLLREGRLAKLREELVEAI